MIEAEGDVVTLHPAAIDKFANSMEEIHAALTGDLDVQQLAPFRAAFRNVFERIVVHPTAKRKPYEGNAVCAAVGDYGLGAFPKMRSTKEMLAEQGVADNKISQGSGS